MTTATIEKAPTLEEVREVEARADEIRHRIKKIETRVERIQSELAQVHAQGLAATDEAEELRDERGGLRDEQGELEVALAHLEAKISTERETACREAAKKRLTEIAQSHRGMRALAEERAEQIVEQAKELEGAIRRRNDEFALIAHLQAEAKVLAARFELQEPRFPTVPQPMRRGEVQTALARIDALRCRFFPTDSTSVISPAPRLPNAGGMYSALSTDTWRPAT